MGSPDQELALLLILAGPTGTGKSTLCSRMTDKYTRIQRVITSTTRPPREGEIDGVDYFFFSNEVFDQMIEEGAFYEYAQVHSHNHRYGTLKAEIQEKLSQNQDLIMNIDVQGVAAFQREAEKDALLNQRLVTVFLMPPSLDEIERRLIDRGKEDRAAIDHRLESAQKEMPLWDQYDFCLISGTKEEDFSRLESIWKAEKLRVARLTE
ncbi:MAG: guanylate kinase [Verrucomicrobia bacterium]|nr:guanylate kinase [Verrucomicrobiota bacterium]